VVAPYDGDIITLQAIDSIDSGKTKLLRLFNCYPDLNKPRKSDFRFLNGLD
jgi:hypothetical protein